MASFEELKILYQRYLEKATEVRRKASAFAGAFNLGDDPRRHGCHDLFYEGVEQWVREFLQESPTPQQAAEVVDFVLRAADAHRDTDAYWYFFAVHGHIRPLIPLLSREDCKRLLDLYDELHPKRERLPLQQEVYKLLKKCSK